MIDPRKVNLDDCIIYCKYGTVEEGRASLICDRGVDVSTPYGNRFIKWCHVIKVIKPNREILTR